MPDSTPFIWTRLLIPSPVSVEQARAALTALATVSGRPRIVLEATGQAGSVGWRLGSAADARSRVLTALRAHLPDLDMSDAATSRVAIQDVSQADTSASLRVRGAREATLNPDAIEPTVRSLYGVLASTRLSESLHLQLVLGSRTSPQALPQATPRRGALKPVERDYRFGCEVRLAASTTTRARSRRLIGSLASALRQLDAPGVRLSLRRTSPRAFSRASSPWLWSCDLSVTEAVALTGWPIASPKAAPLPGLPAAHPRLLRPTSSGRTLDPSSMRALGVATADPGLAIGVGVEDSLRHLHVLGPTGVGKSTLLARLILQDVAAGRGVVVVDPKGDLVDDVLNRLDASRLDDVVVMDARDAAPVGINGLARPKDPDLTADELLGVFHSLYADSWGVRTHDVLHASLLTLARRGDASLVMVPLLLTNPGFRRSIVGRVAAADPLGLGAFWAHWDALSEAERQQATAPLLRRLRPILLRPGLRGVLGQRRPKFELGDVFTKRRILLVSLAKGAIGPEAAALLGSLVVAQFWSAALARIDLDPARRHPVMVYIDEVQDYLRLPGDLGDALAQARGLGVSYTLAHQHLDQLPRALREAIAANARSKIAFQLPPSDARVMAATSRSRLEPIDFESLPAFSAYAQLLDQGSPGAWVSLRTQPLTRPFRPASAVRARSAARFGQPLDEIERDLASLSEVAGQGTTSERIGRVGHLDRPEQAKREESS